MSDLQTITATAVIPCPVEAVWSALTEPQHVSAWLMETSDLRAEPGATFAMETGAFGAASCEVRTVVPQQEFAHTFTNGPLDTVIRWTLAPTEEGTQVTLEHSGFDVDHPVGKQAFASMGAGWQHKLATTLPENVAEHLA